jgi:hypothetical protein
MRALEEYPGSCSCGEMPHPVLRSVAITPAGHAHFSQEQLGSLHVCMAASSIGISLLGVSRNQFGHVVDSDDTMSEEADLEDDLD